MDARDDLARQLAAALAHRALDPAVVADRAYAIADALLVHAEQPAVRLDDAQFAGWYRMDTDAPLRDEPEDTAWAHADALDERPWLDPSYEPRWDAKPQWGAEPALGPGLAAVRRSSVAARRTG